MVLLLGCYSPLVAPAQPGPGPQGRSESYLLGAIAFPGYLGDKSAAGMGAQGKSTPDSGAVALQDGPPLVPPVCLSFYPKKDVVGTLVSIKGKHLSTTASVLFNGLAASFAVVSDDLIQATVPVSATTGKIELVTAGGRTASSGSFRVRHPGITAFMPGQGEIGATVFLAGERLASTREIYFNNVKVQEFQVHSNWAIQAVIPPGASTGKIRVVLAGGGKATSKYYFVVNQQAQLVPDASKAGRQSILPVNPIAETASALSAYPNPFTQEVALRFTLSAPRFVHIIVYDHLGREVGVLFQGEMAAHQPYQTIWRPEARLSGGLYIIRLQTPDGVMQKKIILVR